MWQKMLGGLWWPVRQTISVLWICRVIDPESWDLTVWAELIKIRPSWRGK